MESASRRDPNEIKNDTRISIRSHLMNKVEKHVRNMLMRIHMRWTVRWLAKRSLVPFNAVQRRKKLFFEHNETLSLLYNTVACKQRDVNLRILFNIKYFHISVKVSSNLLKEKVCNFFLENGAIWFFLTFPGFCDSFALFYSFSHLKFPI